MSRANPVSSSFAVEHRIKKEKAAPSKIHVTTEKVGQVSHALLTTLRAPLRYLGSKTWSVPGAIMRAPFLVMEHIGKKGSLSNFKQALLGTGYHRNIQKILTKEELQPYFKYACACAFVHKTQDEWIKPFGFSVYGKQQFSPENTQALPATLEWRENCLYDPTTDLKIAILQRDNEVIIVYGALGSSFSEGGEKSQLPKITQAAIANLLGATPAIYEEADRITAWLRQQPEFKDKQITLAGQCFGASLASYCALKNDLKAVGLNPYPLGAGLQANIGKDKLLHADAHVTSICAKGDKYSDNLLVDIVDRVVSAIGLKTPGSFGKRLAIPSAYNKMSETHNFILGSFMQHLGFHKRAKLDELPATMFTQT